MSNIALKQIHFEGITMQIPEVWDYETEEYQELYVMQISGKWYVGGWYADTDYCYTWFAVENLVEAG